MEGARLLQKLRLTNFLSYGPEGEEIELEPLNVLIGPNGSGKSNFIDAISILKAAPIDILAPIRSGGGIPHWLWKGHGSEKDRVLSLEAHITYPGSQNALAYGVRLRPVNQAAQIVEERILEERGKPVTTLGSLPQEFYRFSREDDEVCIAEPGKQRTLLGEQRPVRTRPGAQIDVNRSGLAQFRDAQTYPEITYLAESFSRISLYRNAGIGRDSPLRGSQPADETAAFLLEDGHNLGLVLNELLSRSAITQKLVDRLRWLLPWVEDIRPRVLAGTVEIHLQEEGLRDSIPSTRLSDGTLRYLCLLTILCHPEPPPLICLEDPEIGLHPDVLPRIAEMLVEASQRAQIIVTTHSDILVSALSDVPEAVVVCERDDRGTHLRRLDPEALKEWLKDYSLGGLWLTGGTGRQPVTEEIRIYVEGGGQDDRTRSRLRVGLQGFLRDLWSRARQRGIHLKIVACGDGARTVRSFHRALAWHPDALNVLLVDAEGPVTEAGARQHLGTRDPRQWTGARVEDDHCHLMVQMMEAWLIVDREKLAEYYGNGFHVNSLPDNTNVEQIDKQTLERSLAKATRDTKKRQYHKTHHAPDILECIRPEVVKSKASHCKRLFDTLAAKIDGN